MYFTFCWKERGCLGRAINSIIKESMAGRNITLTLLSIVHEQKRPVFLERFCRFKRLLFIQRANNGRSLAFHKQFLILYQ